MNIFYLDKDPELAAIYQYNKHVVKMILESAQMLCTAHHCYGDKWQKENVPYKQAHLNHPSTIWTRQCFQNYRWLYLHMLALGSEYTKRYDRTHLTIHKCEKFLRQILEWAITLSATSRNPLQPALQVHPAFD